MRQTITVAICVIVSLVLGAIATRYVHPHWLLATLHSLHLHAAAACVAAMLLALAIRRHVIVWLLFVASIVIATHAVVMNFELSNRPTTAEADAPSFRLLSFNILSNNFGNSTNIAETIIASGADVVNIMEAAPIWRQLDVLARVYPYRIGCGVGTDTCDQLMLSKTPIEAATVSTLSDIFPSRFILAKITIAGHAVNVVGIHTTKPYFDNFLSQELERAAWAIIATDGPLVLSGDFNASSLAPNMRRFLALTNLRTGGWEPATWPIRAGMFGLPIDHVYARAPAKVKSVDRIEDAHGSNHFGLIAEIAITGE